MVVNRTQPFATPRGGFTFIELMVAIGIFVTLLAITAGLIDLSNTSQRVRAASNQVQAMLEGARSRAFKSGSPVGVRLMLDDSNGTRATALMYVAAPTDPSSSSATHRGTLRYVDLDAGGGVVQAIQFIGKGTAWNDLKSQQLLQPGVRIRIPADTGNWYYISGQNFLENLAPVGNPNNSYDYTVMRLTDALLDAPTTNGDLPLPDVSLNDPLSQQFTYELDLSTVNVPYAGATPEELPRGTCIDLSSSSLPPQWNISGWAASTTVAANTLVGARLDNGRVVFFRAQNTGTTGSSTPNWVAFPGGPVVDGGVNWDPLPSLQLDIMFAPNGSVYGAIGTAGVIHLVIGNTDDSDADIRAFDLADYDGDGQGPDHQSEYRAVTIFTNSGSVQISPLDLTDSDANNVADNMFRFAMEGETAR